MSSLAASADRTTGSDNDRYKWVALSNTMLGVLMATMNSSIVLISLPAIFRGLNVYPLDPAEGSYLLWMLLGYMVVTATLLVTIGRLSDMWGRVRIYNLGFVIFTVGSILLFATPLSGNHGALWMIICRLIQGVGGGCLIANSTAILTDAFPPRERGFAIGLNMVATLGGSLVGLLLGGVLAIVWWRAVFLVSVPFGIVGTIWSYRSLHEQAGKAVKAHVDIIGNLCFGLGLTIFLVAITYGIMPYGTSSTGWGNPRVIAGMVVGIVLLLAFVFVEQRIKDPLFNLKLFKIRPFAAGCAAQITSALAYGGLQFVIIVWLQGVWLPMHGISFEDTPLWAAIAMIPMMAGFMIFGAMGGWLSDRLGQRGLTTGGMLVLAASFVALAYFPADFSYIPFGIVLFVIGAAFGSFSAPNATAIMNSLPAAERGVGSGMRSTAQGIGSPLSLAFFFSMIVIVLAEKLPNTILHGLLEQGVPHQTAVATSQIPGTGALFAAFLGYNPMETLLPTSVLNQLSDTARQTVLGNHFFPSLLSAPFMSSLKVVFLISAALCVLAAIFSYLRGPRFVYEEVYETKQAATPQPEPLATASRS